MTFTTRSSRGPENVRTRHVTVTHARSWRRVSDLSTRGLRPPGRCRASPDRAPSPCSAPGDVPRHSPSPGGQRPAGRGGGSPLGLTKFGNDSLGLGGRDRGARGTYTARASARGGRGGAQGSPFRLGAPAPSSATMTGALAGPGTAGRDRAPARCQAAPPASHPRCCRLETTAPFLQKRKPGRRGAR